ncbi:MAG: sigma-E factor negative regulatory protein [Gammaproteobacteria bacterium]|nr:sigma-E factor negative regulatory protein [Gammaproteobacteria bacterium]
MSEKISELIDGRGAPAQRHDVFDHIIADPGAGRTWRRYHLIGCVLRGEVGPGPGGAGDGGDCCARIEARLEAETMAADVVPLPGATVAPAAAPKLRRRAWTTATKTGAAATLALAASLALVAVMVLRPGTDGGGATPVAQRASSAAATHIQRVSFDPEFGEMLAQHGEFAASPGLNGLIVHAKLVSNEALDR